MKSLSHVRLFATPRTVAYQALPSMGFSKARVLEWGAIAFSELIATNPIFGSILKSRDITFPIKVRLVKATVFPVVMYGGESWTIKKVEKS